MNLVHVVRKDPAGPAERSETSCYCFDYHPLQECSGVSWKCLEMFSKKRFRTPEGSGSANPCTAKKVARVNHVGALLAAASALLAASLEHAGALLHELRSARQVCEKVVLAHVCPAGYPCWTRPEAQDKQACYF